MKKFGLIVLSFVIVLLGFWLGLMANFPGEMASSLVESRLNRFGVVEGKLSPAELRWTGLYVPRMDLLQRRPEGAVTLITLSDVGIPITYRLIWGLPIEAVVGKTGFVEGFLPWGQGAQAEFSGEVLTEEIPVPAFLKPISIQGQVTISGDFTMDPGGRKGNVLPNGQLTGRAQSLQLRGFEAVGQEIPLTTLDVLELQVESRGKITVKKFEFKGDLQGRVEGDITPNLQALRNSQLNLRISTSFRNSWLDKLGTVKPIVESFLNRGQIQATLHGTLAQPNVQAVK